MKVSKIIRRIIYISFATAWLSGSGFYILKTFFMQEGEFGPESHPLQYLFLQAHGASSFVMMLMYGFMLGSHIKFAWKKKPIASLDIILMCIPALLMITGYLLYYIAGEYSREIVGLIHLGLGLILPFMLIAHIISHRKQATYQRIKYATPQYTPRLPQSQ